MQHKSTCRANQICWKHFNFIGYTWPEHIIQAHRLGSRNCRVTCSIFKLNNQSFEPHKIWWKIIWKICKFLARWSSVTLAALFKDCQISPHCIYQMCWVIQRGKMNSCSDDCTCCDLRVLVLASKGRPGLLQILFLFFGVPPPHISKNWSGASMAVRLECRLVAELLCGRKECVVLWMYLTWYPVTNIFSVVLTIEEIKNKKKRLVLVPSLKVIAIPFSI